MDNIEKLNSISYNEIVYTIGGTKMDRIIQSMVDSFKINQNLEIKDNSLQFEFFSYYCVVNSVYGMNDFDLEDITTGKATQGIDGIAIVVNQKL